jgi:hypothetical protein
MGTRLPAIYLTGVGVLAPGLEGWTASRPVLSGHSHYAPGSTLEPNASLLPANERRRSSALVRWAVQTAAEAVDHALADPRALATVFASSEGETGILDRICTALASTDRQVSPTLFHHSVHNAAAGYWCIATGNQRSSTSIAGYDASFSGGLLEAAAYVAVERETTLFVAYDIVPPPALHPARPLTANFAVAFVLEREASARATASLRLALGPATPATPSAMVNPELEALRPGNPAARSLPLLAALATGKPAGLIFDYLKDQHLSVEVLPCPR